MSTIRVSPGALPAWVDKTNARHRRALLRGIHLTTAEVEGAVKIRTGEIKPHAPISTGDYRRRWKHANGPDGGRVFNESSYAGIIEEGARPGRIPLPRTGVRGGPVPMAPIRRWTYLKFKGRFRFRNEGEAWGLAVSIQRALHRRGLRAKRVLTAPEFVRKTLDITQANVRRELAKVAP